MFLARNLLTNHIMEKTDDAYKLENVDVEDLSDVLLQIEKRFQIRFSDTAFKDAKTFGDICDVVQNNITLPHVDDCTTQQAFYKVRKALTVSCNMPTSGIEPATTL